MKFTVNTQFESGFLSPSYQIFPNKTLIIIIGVHWAVSYTIQWFLCVMIITIFLA